MNNVGDQIERGSSGPRFSSRNLRQKLANLQQCADDAVADANTCRKLADRQTRLLEEAQAVIDKLRKASNPVMIFVGNAVMDGYTVSQKDGCITLTEKN